MQIPWLHLVSKLYKEMGIDLVFLNKGGISYLAWAGTLELDIFDPDCLIQISNVDTFNLLLNPLILGKVQKN